MRGRHVCAGQLAHPILWIWSNICRLAVPDLLEPDFVANALNKRQDTRAPLAGLAFLTFVWFSLSFKREASLSFPFSNNHGISSPHTHRLFHPATC
jgi:hypothetical protein